jgi:hypothetical protein
VSQVFHFGNIAPDAIIAKYKTYALVRNYLAFALLVRERNYPAIPEGWTVSKVYTVAPNYPEIPDGCRMLWV